MEAAEETTGEIPERAVTLDGIAGMESAKRALEVALAGEHGIVFVFNSNSQAPQLVRVGKRIAEDLGIAFHGFLRAAECFSVEIEALLASAFELRFQKETASHAGLRRRAFAVAFNSSRCIIKRRLEI